MALVWETTRASEGNSSADEGFSCCCLWGKEELERVAAHAVGEKPLCAAHIVGIVGWLPCSPSRQGGPARLLAFAGA